MIRFKKNDTQITILTKFARFAIFHTFSWKLVSTKHWGVRFSSTNGCLVGTKKITYNDILMHIYNNNINNMYIDWGVGSTLICFFLQIQQDFAPLGSGEAYLGFRRWRRGRLAVAVRHPSGRILGKWWPWLLKSLLGSAVSVTRIYSHSMP